jgi:transposase
MKMVMKMLRKVPFEKYILRFFRENNECENEYENEYETEYNKVIRLIKENKLKRVDKRLQVIKLYLENKYQLEIANKTGFSREWVNKLIKEYREKGIDEYARHKYGGNNRAMSFEEEAEILRQFEDVAAKGTLVIANSIKKAFDEKRGKDTGNSYIYTVLKRHSARKIMPQTSHPKKATAEAIEASKKLTLATGN